MLAREKREDSITLSQHDGARAPAQVLFKVTFENNSSGDGIPILMPSAICSGDVEVQHSLGVSMVLLIAPVSVQLDVARGAPYDSPVFSQGVVT